MFPFHPLTSPYQVSFDGSPVQQTDGASDTGSLVPAKTSRAKSTVSSALRNLPLRRKSEPTKAADNTETLQRLMKETASKLDTSKTRPAALTFWIKSVGMTWGLVRF